MAERQNRVKRLEREEMEIEEDIRNLLGMEILRNLAVIRIIFLGPSTEIYMVMFVSRVSLYQSCEKMYIFKQCYGSGMLLPDPGI
jgi:hypothetical protein